MDTRHRSYLVRRGEVFYFRRWVPIALRGIFGCAEIKFSLKTANRLQALQRASVADYLFEQVLFELSTMSKHQGLKREHINYLLREYFEAIREQVRDDWRSGVQTEGFNYDDAIAGLEEHEMDLKNLAGQDRIPRWAADHAKMLLNEYGISENRLNKANRDDLIDGVFQAQLEGFRILRARYSGHFDELEPKNSLFKSEAPYHTSPIATSESPSLEVVVEKYIALKSKNEWVDKTVLDNTRVLRWFKELVGDKKPMSDLCKSDIINFRDELLALPSNSKKFKELSDIKFGEFSSLQHAYATISQRTARKYIQMLKTFLIWCSDEEYIQAVPGKNVTIAANYDPADARYSFTPTQLKKLFSAPYYTGCKSAGRPFEVGECHFRNEKFWLPLIALFTGMRLSEITQLHVDDLVQKDDVWYFDVTTLSKDELTVTEESDAKTLKTPHSKRTVPVHTELLKIGLVEFHNERKAKKTNSKRLFLDPKPDSTSSHSARYSKFFSRFAKRAGAKSMKTSFHSLRHNFKDALQSASVSDPHQDALMGHTDKKQAKYLYGSGVPLSVRAAAISKIESPIDLSHLYVKD